MNKTNRRLLAASCLLLSAKLNDIKGAQLTLLVQEMVEFFKLRREDLIRVEFACLVALEFSLHVPDSDVYQHYKRLPYS